MINVITVNVDDIDNKFVEDLKKDYAHADVNIIVQDQDKSDQFKDEDFWKIIGMLNWSATSDEAIIAPAVEFLSQQPLPDIYRFADILSEKLWQLDTRSHAQNLLHQQEDDYLSVDDFLYSRCAVVANGKHFFEDILNAPSSMPEDVTFEPLLAVAPEAYERKTGKRFTAVSAYNYETYSNKNGWAKA